MKIIIDEISNGYVVARFERTGFGYERLEGLDASQVVGAVRSMLESNEQLHALVVAQQRKMEVSDE